MYVDAIGFLAGLLSTISLVPQIVKSYRSRNLKDISFHSLLLILGATGLWTLYGILITSYPLIIAVGFQFLVVLGIFILKLIHG